MMKKPTQTEIATELGITKAALSKLKRAGMPVHSADAARAWRSANLHPGRVRPDPGPSPRTLVERLQALQPLAVAALEAGRFDLVAEEMRRAMRRVPESHRNEVMFEAAVLDALLGAEVLAELRGDPQQPATEGCDDGPPDWEYVGRVVYALACGEMELVPA